MPSLHLVTYNIRKGKGSRTRAQGMMGAVTDALQRLSPDILLCQEVFHGPTADHSQSDLLAAALGLEPFYRPNKQRRIGHHGNATFVRWPAELVENHDLSTNPFERRGVLHVRFTIEGCPVHVFNTHLGLNNRQRKTQVERIAEIIEACAHHEPLILAGDFNDWNGHLDQVLVHSLGLTNVFGEDTHQRIKTWPTRRPVFGLDRIYVRNFETTQTKKLDGEPWTELSDHLPLSAELVLP